jgi:hypothetical protein
LCLPLNKQSEINYNGKILKKIPFRTDYNSNVYRLRKEENRWRCSCQGWKSKEDRGEGRPDGCQCSHTLALFLFFKLSKNEKEKYLRND